MTRRPTIHDVAREAGVSTATVDRVLNAREKVREDTARRVYEAARLVGYHATPLIGQRVQMDLPRLRLGVVLHKEKQAFYQTFKTEIERAVAQATGLRASAIIEFAPSQTPADFAALMDGLATRVDAVAATAVTHPEVTEAVLRLNAKGIPCFALLNDFAQGVRQNYLGLNNMKIGRIAAHLIAISSHQAGKIAVFVGGYRWHGHELRETGFRSYFREYAPQFTVLDTLVNLETRQLTYEATLDLLNRHPDLRGIYCAGGGMEGAIAALREVRQPGEVTLVVNELTPESRAALISRYVGMAIATPLGKLCADLVTVAAEAVRDGITPLQGQHFLQPDLYLPESV
ncbi:MAG: LacI family transcriptional regulator [Rhodobacteraceae bacterium]|uniref:LacI family DNA-binding transcriptional regulator n=1 Tax=Cypionkella sp. TaxID=2811411 RepID=UPI001327E01B|nr:LacI family DNA-binding transcriptional regulator [Cypionkella sp.]KAF0175032.1 MAG: LacI family transcriptional regulator [Paracoccaceae bacterium]MDO8325476.1 LacI family DNA-binding transcriptional regulator [Cypionkella sp.]